MAAASTVLMETLFTLTVHALQIVQNGLISDAVKLRKF